ncbi:calpain-12 isoform X2 [Hemicordylus capensis]|uniref:calpain-12 isoform X2 n=1 Tax=Hemicordylus capensis TaxID=884348 RepID=UPI002302D9FD|nr:calpain-12 isoform X2 [Hemicordylus capensis]
MGYLFTDPYFQACPQSIGTWMPQPGLVDTRGLVWKRPKDISKPRFPTFVREGMSRFDVRQGRYLGDCWFLAAAASLTLYPRFLHRVVPQDQSFGREDYAGIFHFQFWQYGQWVDVVVDDLLPTVNGELLFVYSAQNDEFWMPLLEKAYAKLNGSYMAMDGGFMNEAFVDFTGGIGEVLSLKTPNSKLFKIIQAAVSRRSLMGAHLKVKSYADKEAVTAEGLVKGHAYSITGAHKLSMEGKKVKLLRLRNPWGKEEWKGRWCDSSPLWSYLDPELRKKLNENKEDGEFWMQLVDFIRYFDGLEICHLSADALDEEGTPSSWDIKYFQGNWTKGLNAGGMQNNYWKDTFWMNPQLHVSLQEPDEDAKKKNPTCTLIVSLMQKNWRRSSRTRKVTYISVFQVSKEYLQLKSTAERRKLLHSLKAVCPPFTEFKRDVTGYLQLPPGDYLIIPSTQKPMEEAEFTLCIYIKNKHQLLEIDEEINADGKTPQVMLPLKAGLEQQLEKTFLEWAGQDQQMGIAELQGLLTKTMATTSQLKMDGFSREDCQKIIQLFSDSGTGRLTLHEFSQFWTKMREWEGIFFTYDQDRSGTMNTHEMRMALDAAGFHLNKQTFEVLVTRYSNPWLQIDFDSFISFMVHLESVFGKCKSRDANQDGLIYMTREEWMELVTSP